MPSFPRWSAYIVASQVMRDLSTPEGLARAADLLAAAGVTKVYLDVYRGIMCDETVLVRARDYLAGRGFEVAAGITTIAGRELGRPSTHGLYWLCFSAPESRAVLEQGMRLAARLADEIIVDDFLATMCRCPECTAGRGGRAWGEFYSDQLVEVAERVMLSPARAENPKVRVTIKYPQWYDRFHCFGYDVLRHPGLFDRVFAGTETRDPEVEYVQPYQAFNNYRWLAAIAGDKMAGAWFDSLNTAPEVYVEQAYQSVLAGAPEIVLFCYSPTLFGPDSPHLNLLKEHMPRLAALAGLIAGKERMMVPAYKPPCSDGGDEAYLYDYLGMWGLPTAPAPGFPAGSRAAIFPRQATADPEFPRRLRQFLAAGGTALLTAGALETLEPALLADLGFASPPTSPVDVWTFRYQVGDKDVKGPGWVRFTRRLHPAAGEVLASAVTEGETFPILTAAPALGGRVVAIAARSLEYRPDSTRVTVGEPVPLIHLPDAVAGALQQALLPPGVGLQAQHPSRVAWYLFAGGPMVIESFRDTPTTVHLALDPEHLWAGRTLTDPLGGETFPPLPDSPCRWQVPMPRRSVRALLPAGKTGRNPS